MAKLNTKMVAKHYKYIRPHIMTPTRHFKFINSKTGNAIYYHTHKGIGDEAKLKAVLEKLKDEVATKNGVFSGTIYWVETTEK